MAQIGIGIDSGGTHTTCAVDRGDGPVSTASDETSNSISDARGQRSSRAAIEWIVQRILAHSGPDDEVCVWIGAAASFPGPAARRLQEEVRHISRRVHVERPDCEIYAANDAVSLLKAPPLLSEGVVAIVGTGNIVLGAHPSLPDEVVRRGGYEWPVGDTASGVWMTVEAVRLLLEDIERQGSDGYHSALLDRLCDYFSIASTTIDDVPEPYHSIARAEAVASTISLSCEDNKRVIAGFVGPHLFELGRFEPGRTHDPLAAQVIAASVSYVKGQIDDVSKTLAAYTADKVNDRSKLSLTVAGSIAANPTFRVQLAAELSKCNYVGELTVVADSADRYASLAGHYLRAPIRERRLITRNLDPMHQVARVM